MFGLQELGLGCTARKPGPSPEGYDFAAWTPTAGGVFPSTGTGTAGAIPSTSANREPGAGASAKPTRQALMSTLFEILVDPIHIIAD